MLKGEFVVLIIPFWYPDQINLLPFFTRTPSFGGFDLGMWQGGVWSAVGYDAEYSTVVNQPSAPTQSHTTVATVTLSVLTSGKLAHGSLVSVRINFKHAHNDMSAVSPCVGPLTLTFPRVLWPTHNTSCSRTSRPPTLPRTAGLICLNCAVPTSVIHERPCHVQQHKMARREAWSAATPKPCFVHHITSRLPSTPPPPRFCPGRVRPPQACVLRTSRGCLPPTARTPTTPRQPQKIRVAPQAENTNETSSAKEKIFFAKPRNGDAHEEGEAGIQKTTPPCRWYRSPQLLPLLLLPQV